MKHINLLRFLGAAVCVTFASCESTWPYGASDTESRRGSGYSLDNPPSSQSRYLPGPAGASTTTTAPASYGSPVPGRKGFVYPPGSDQKPENMVDVRDFTPGQKVRDPRTGKVFLVP